MPAITTTQAVSPGYVYTVTASSETIVRDEETNKLLCKANNGSQGMFIAIGGTVVMATDDPTAIITQSSTTSGGARFEVQQTRPATGEKGVIYLIPIASSTDEEDEYEEWIWVKGEWERLGTTGVNLSNYATLTNANTYSGDNTFNGLLLKKNSPSLGDTSVLNRNEADIRYGKLSGENFWDGSQRVNGTLTMHPNAAIRTNKIQGIDGAGNLFFSGLHLIDITNVKASAMYTPTVHADILKTKEIRAAQNTNKIDFTNSAGSGAVDVSGISELRLASVHATSDVTVPLLHTNAIAPISGGSIRLRGVNELVVMEPPANTQTTLSGIRFLKYNNVTVDSSEGAMLVQAPEGIKIASNQIYPSKVTIAPSEIEAFPLNQDVFGENKYGLRITEASCQLFGIDFNYGDVWSETNDELKKNNLTPIPGLDSANYIGTVKIRKPAVSIETTGIGSLSFDYATEAYIRTFPNDGGQGIFEFQAGNWVNSDRKFIKRGPVDLRKASATELGPTSVLNMEEGDARWGGGSEAVLVDSKIPDWMSSPQTALVSVADTGPSGVFGVAIGPNVTANIYKDLAIGGWLDTSQGQGGNTLLGYGFRVTSTTKGAVAIGYADMNSEVNDNAIVIGYECLTNGKDIIAIGGNVSGNLGIALNGTAGAQAIALGGIANEKAITIGYNATAAKFGTALGSYSVAGINEFVMQTNGNPAISMQLYGGTDWDSHDTTGYLKFVAAPSAIEIKQLSSTEREEITIHKKPLWDAIQRAKDYNYPAQPIALIENVGLWDKELQPNTIYVLNNADDLDLSAMVFAPVTSGNPKAELQIEVYGDYAPPTVEWPTNIIWFNGDGAATTAPVFKDPSGLYPNVYGISLRKLHIVTTNEDWIVARLIFAREDAT